MRFLEDTPIDGHAFIYANTEDIPDAEEFFKLVAEKLLNSAAIEKMTKAAEGTKSVFKQFTENVSEIKLWNIGVKLNQAEPPKYKSEFENLMQKLDTEEFKIIIMLDEFPVTIENIKNEQGEKAAISFLHANRGIRQQANKGIQFIYTGSIGLTAIAGRLNATATLNDLNVIEIPPLSTEEAIKFSKLILGEYKVECSGEIISYMLDKLKWLMPFFIQLIIQVLIDEYDETGKPLTKKSVDRAFLKSSTHRSNLYFENYLTRLNKSLPPKEAELAQFILMEIAIKNEMPKEALNKLENAGRVLEMLELDGYINFSLNAYRFNSPILRDWWRKHAN